MKNTKANIVIIALMLVTFFGQALASVTMSCTHEMTMDMELSMMAHDNMPDTASHASMMLDNGEQDSSQIALMDCCQEQCKCPMSGCISLSFLFDTRFNTVIITEQKIVQLPLIHQSQINTSLYRPPIS
ncbi:MAG: hypothetical protein QNK36_20695 [Colwellia sp.]|nr:hypothetical protein [Colwellia sp.]